MQKLKNIALLFFVSFLFLGVCGFSISEHLCTTTEEVCEMHEEHKENQPNIHDCCEVPVDTKQDDCCKEETKVFQTTLNHYHDVLVKVTVPYLATVPAFDFFIAESINEAQITQYYPNPPPLTSSQVRAQLQVYTL
ncbi:HYC_CC_PP family protein [Lishizhenia sp.]|uniref:HYC_CC_PP family protein n=1 Tax=Lishizhenia sp. TaxID=2497594 RepID=UPI00299F4753|nr:hypothetical protein [Lishizhenia sp.]MDX1446251.1 hypothetical protein [Lishizhenia sp.]